MYIFSILFSRVLLNHFDRGKPLDITVKGYAKDGIFEGSQAKLVMKLGVVKIMEKSIDLCEEVFNGTSVECPVAPGPIEFVKTDTKSTCVGIYVKR